MVVVVGAWVVVVVVVVGCCAGHGAAQKRPSVFGQVLQPGPPGLHTAPSAPKKVTHSASVVQLRHARVPAQIVPPLSPATQTQLTMLLQLTSPTVHKSAPAGQVPWKGGAVVVVVVVVVVVGA